MLPLGCLLLLISLVGCAHTFKMQLDYDQKPQDVRCVLSPSTETPEADFDLKKDLQTLKAQLTNYLNNPAAKLECEY